MVSRCWVRCITYILTGWGGLSIIQKSFATCTLLPYSTKHFLKHLISPHTIIPTKPFNQSSLTCSHYQSLHQIYTKPFTQSSKILLPINSKISIPKLTPNHSTIIPTTTIYQTASARFKKHSGIILT